MKTPTPDSLKDLLNFEEPKFELERIDWSKVVLEEHVIALEELGVLSLEDGEAMFGKHEPGKEHIIPTPRGQWKLKSVPNERKQLLLEYHFEEDEWDDFI